MDSRLRLIIAGIIIAVVIFGGVAVAEARPVRNHNPGDLRWDGSTQWLGQIGVDNAPGGPFVIFDTDEHGARAAAITAIHYHTKDGINTLTEFGLRWAPPADNNGSSEYGAHLADVLGVDPDAPFDFVANLVPLLDAIFKNEDFGNPVLLQPSVIRQAATDAINATQAA